MASNFAFDSIVSEIFAMMSATILGAARNLSNRCHQGRTNRIALDTSEGKIYIYGAGNKAMLVCLTNGHPNPGVMEDEMGRAAEKVETLV